MKQKLWHYIFIYSTAIVLLTGCNMFGYSLVKSDPNPDNKDKVVTTATTTREKPAELSADNKVLIENLEPAINKRHQIVVLGDGHFIAKSKAKNEIAAANDEGDITLNFQGTDINEFVKAILGDVLNFNFVIDPQVSGTVTIETANPVSEEQLLPILEEILSINNAAIVYSNGLYKILPKSKAIKGNLSPDTTLTPSDFGYNVRIVPLKFIAAQEMQKILSPFITASSDLHIDKQRNMLILSGTPDELKRLQDTIDIFDVDWLRGMSVGLYPLNYVAPKILKAELEKILGNVEGPKSNELLGGLVRIISLERLNSILLISATLAALREAEGWLSRLDKQGEQIGQNLYVYNIQNAKAIGIAKILNNIFDKASATVTSTPFQLAPGTTPVEIAPTSGTTKDLTQTPTTPTAPVSVGDSGLPLTSVGKVKIIADDTRNALVILASSRDYKMVAAAIRKLDVIPLQVLIEASILEVTLNGDLQYGVEWFFNNKVGGSRTGQGQLDLGNAGLTALTGFAYTIVNSAAKVKAVLNALKTGTNVNVLSAPSLMVLDNQTATINVGDEIPVPTRQSISNNESVDARTVNEIQFRKTGITLTVTPRVNNSGLVTMEIKQEVSNAIDTTSSGIDAPTIQQRQIESTVAIHSGQTIILGGLIRDSKTKNESGIPGLYKIPLIGKLFGNTSVEKRRTELIVLLTPRVARNGIDAKKITDEFRNKLHNLPR